MTNFLDLLEDLEKNPLKRKYSESGYRLADYRAWVQTVLATRGPAEAPAATAGNEFPLERPAVHLAGTKGKGSTAALVDALLNASGLRSGLYTSPHQLHYGERFRLQGQAISAERFETLGREILQRGYTLLPREKPTVFELLTATALQLFEQENLDAEVYEVGLGGRLDCTNIIEPRVTVITSIGLDHTAILGDTHEKIAFEKAGILKSNVPAVVFAEGNDERQNAARDVILSRAKDVGTPLIPLPRCEPLGLAENKDGKPICQRIRIHWPNNSADGLECDLALLGEHQIRNAELALAAVQTFLEQQGRELSPECIATGLESVIWTGRLQYLRSLPAVLVDSAHCPHSAAALGRSLKELSALASPPYVLLWGMQKDKDHKSFLEAFLSAVGQENVSRIICYTLSGERGAPATILFTAARECVMKAMAQETLEDAFNSALTFARPGSVVALGSVYPTGHIVELHQQKVKGATKHTGS
ncbi:MAG: bifunctional folylpolyglutamate synthase/dihydrofolate synthase [Sumerlaeia bacterium]